MEEFGINYSRSINENKFTINRMICKTAGWVESRKGVDVTLVMIINEEG
jgi:hypothetical protein